MCVGTDVTTATIVGVTFIDIWKEDGVVLLCNFGSTYPSILQTVASLTTATSSITGQYISSVAFTPESSWLVHTKLSTPTIVALTFVHIYTKGLEICDDICRETFDKNIHTPYHLFRTLFQLTKKMFSSKPHTFGRKANM